MDGFNRMLIDYLDCLNRFLAGVFVSVALFKGIALSLEAKYWIALLETISVLGCGLLACGLIALGLSIHSALRDLREKLG